MWRLFEGSYYSRYRRRGYYLFQLYRNAATIRGRLLFEVQTSRLLFISALPQCGDYSRAATIRSTDIAATIYFSSTAMRRLFEGGYYSKYRHRGYYLFQLYRNAATIRGRLLFEVQTSRLLFISALPQCGDYSRAATIRSTDVAATIYFSSTAMRRLFEGGYYSKYRRRGYYLFQLYRNAATIRGRLLFEVQTSRLLFISALPQCGDYSRAATIRSTDIAATIYFSSTAMRRLFEGGYYSKYRHRGYYLFQLYRNAATIRGRLLFEVQTSRLLFISALPQCGDYSRAATIRSTDVAATIYFSSTAMRRLFEGGYYSKYRRRGYYLFQLYRNAATIRGRLLFEVQTSRLLFISALPQCGDYSRAATIRSTDIAATIYFSSTAMRRLFEGGYYSKYRHRGYYLFQRYRNAATIRGRLLFEVQTSRLLFISALPQCGDYSRAATIRSTDIAATIYFSSTAMRRLFEGGYYSKYRRRGYYLFQLYRNAATIRGRLLFEVQTSRLLFISALPQCGDYSRAATIRSTDIAATIYFSSTAMRRLFEGGYYSKYRRRGYYLFQLYRNAATIRGRLLFEVQTSRLLFISALPQCGDYSRAATIRSTDVAATIYFSSTAMRRLFEGGYYSKYRRRGYILFEVQTSRLLFISALPQCGDYSRAATIRSTDIAATIYFSSTAMRRLFEGGYYSKYRHRGYYLFQLYRNAATIRGRLLFEVQTSRLLFISALPQCGDYSRAATIRSTDVAATIYFSSTAMRRLFEGGYYSKYRRRGYYLFQLYRNAATIRGRLLFEVQTSRLLFISALPQCGDYSRAATIRSTDIAATIYFSSTAMRRLFEGGYYSKYRRRGYYLFQLYRNAATIRGRLLFEVQTSRLLFISALPQCGDYSRAATIRSTDVAATIYFSSTAMRRLFEGGYYSKYRHRGYYLFQLYRNAATIRGRLLFEVQTSRLLFISALPQCGDYSRVATIRSTDIAATIYFSATAMRRLFEGGYYSRYRRRGYYLFQRYRNAATIRGRLLFEVQTSRLLFISALPQCGDYSRAATIRGVVYSRKYGNCFYKL